MPYYNRDPKRDHNFDNHPCECRLIHRPELFAGLAANISAIAPEDPQSLRCVHGGPVSISCHRSISGSDLRPEACLGRFIYSNFTHEFGAPNARLQNTKQICFCQPNFEKQSKDPTSCESLNTRYNFSNMQSPGCP